MGDQVGEIFYGILISDTDFDRIFREINEGKGDSESTVALGNGCELFNPYETEDFHIIVEESRKATYNQGRPLSADDVTVKPEWMKKIQDTLVKFNVSGQAQEEHLTGKDKPEPGWWLVGHYN